MKMDKSAFDGARMEYHRAIIRQYELDDRAMIRVKVNEHLQNI